MPDIVDHLQGAVGDHLVQILADLHRHDQIVAALQNERPAVESRNIGSMVGKKRHAGKLLGYFGVGATKTAREFFAQLRPVGRPISVGAMVLDQPR